MVDYEQNRVEEDNMEWLAKDRTEWRKTAWSGWLKTEQSGGRQHEVVDYGQNRVGETA